jgi:hypothetical protein
MISTTDPLILPMTRQDDAVLWQHPALCRLALPLRAPRSGTWARETGALGAAMGADPTATREPVPLPSGRLLRLLLLHVFTAALRGGTAAADIGPDIAAVAAALGLEDTPPRLRELQDQLDRLAGARLRVSEGRQAPLSVLDGRAGRGQRSGPATWRPVLRLTERFFASLQQGAVPLRRAAVIALADSAPALSAPALDAYAWLAATLPGVADDRPEMVPWESLQQQFGPTAALPAPDAPFRATFTASLEAVREVYPAARFTAGPDGVELRRSPGPVEAAAAPAPAFPVNADPAETPSLADPPVATPAAPSTPEPSALEPGVVERVVLAEPVPAEAPEEPAAPSVQAAAVVAPRATPEWERNGGRIRLAPVLTGLAQSVWLRRGGDEEGATIEVTPGADYHPARRSLLMLEPVILQVAGQLHPRELEEIAAWAAANADLIQDYWDGTIASVFDVAGRVRPVPATRW